jgi:hypothetical protein
MLGLELEDMLALAMACAIAMLVGQFLFSDRYMFFLPMNWFLPRCMSRSEPPMVTVSFHRDVP